MNADLALVNGKIFTACTKQPWAEALAVWRGRLLAVGDADQVKPLIGRGTEVIDAGGKTVIPGFYDAHCHMASMGSEHALEVDCTPEKLHSIEEIVAAFRKAAASKPAGQWLLGYGYDETKLKEKRHPTCWELDRASTAHPILLKSFTYHFGVVNSKAFELAGIGRGTPDPSGGVYDRNADGQPNGLCFETAFFNWLSSFGGAGPASIPQYSDEQKSQGLALVCRSLNRMGITSIGDATSDPSVLLACQSADRKGELTVRINLMMHEKNFALLRDAGLRTGFGNERCKVGSIKSFADGACAGRTVWLSTPYGDKPDYHGIPVKTPEEMQKAVKEYHEAGFQISVHANGDLAINMVLDAYEKAMAAAPRPDCRHRLEHCTFVTPDILRRMKKLGVGAAPFANYVITQSDKLGVYGDWISSMFAHRSFLDHGILVGGSTDSPVVTVHALTSIQSMVTRKAPGGQVLGPQQKVSVEEAVSIYTLGSAHLSFDEKIKGSLEPGKLADFVVLEQDLFRVPPGEISSIQVRTTVMDGKIVFAE